MRWVALTGATCSVLRLQSDTPASWVQAVEPVLDEVLLDHAWLETRAAGVALGLLSRVAEVHGAAESLTALAQEELEHFGRCRVLLSARGIHFRRLLPATYARRLHDRAEPGLVDRLLVCALIEARSCERMRRLSEGLGEQLLREFYADLLTSEARHFSLYVDLARWAVPGADVDGALDRLAKIEAEVLESAPFEARLHGGPNQANSTAS